MSYYDFLSSSLFQDQNLINELIKTAQDPQAIQIAGRLAAVLKEQMMEPGKEVELPDTFKLDSVPQAFDLKNPDPGNIPLYVVNLKSAADFRQWLANHNIVIKTNAGRTSTINEMGNFDQNAAIQYIYNRAEWYSRNYVPETKTKCLAYFNKAKQVASELKYNPTQPNGTQSTQQSPSGQTDKAKLVRYIAGLRPFNSEYINTSILSKFVDTYAQINSNVVGQVNQLNTAISKANQMMNGFNIFKMTNLNLNTLKYSHPQIDSLVPLLLNIVSSVGTLYKEFSTDPEAVSQIGDAMSAIQQQDLPLRTNIEELTTLNQDIIAAKQKRGF